MYLLNVRNSKGEFLLSLQGISTSLDASNIHNEQSFLYEMLLKDTSMNNEG